jgi:hypothetical protein
MKKLALFSISFFAGLYKYLKLKHPLLLDLIIIRLHNLPFKKIFQVSLILQAFYIFLQCKGLLPKKCLKNQHAFITGGGMGIGKKVALILAS